MNDAGAADLPTRKRKNMKTHHYIALLLRCASLALLIYGIANISILLQFIYVPSTLNKAVSFIVFLFPFMLSSLLWFFPVTIAKILTPPECDKDIQPLSYTSLSSILISAIGVCLVVNTLPDALYWLAVFNMNPEIPDNHTSENKANAMATALEIFLAVFIIIKSHAIARYIRSK